MAFPGIASGNRTTPPWTVVNLVSAKTPLVAIASPFFTTNSAPGSKLYTSPDRIQINPPLEAVTVVFPWRSVFCSATKSANFTSPAKSVATSLTAFSVLVLVVLPPSATSATKWSANTCWPLWIYSVEPWVTAISWLSPVPDFLSPSIVKVPLASTYKASSPCRVR